MKNTNPSARRGISLMEVLISMFVLAVGLLGVAALIPAGRHEIVEATKLETAAMVGRGAFRDIQTRGYMNPKNWYRRPLKQPYAPNQPVYNPGSIDPTKPFTIRTAAGIFSPSDQIAFAFDPLGRTAPPDPPTTPSGDYGIDFPAVTGSSNPRLARFLPFPADTNDRAQARGVYDNIFRSSVDLSTDPNATNKDLPPTQRFFESGGSKLRRMSEGNYSWLATIVSDPTRPAIGGEVLVSVAVFYKRVLAKTPDNKAIGEYVGSVNQFPLDPVADPAVRMVRMTGGGEVVVNLPTSPVNNRIVPLKPGNWLMLAGTITVPNPSGPPPTKDLYYFHWYRVLSAANPDVAAGTQRVTLAGQDWNIVASKTFVLMFDNIVSVYEKSMALEVEY